MYGRSAVLDGQQIALRAVFVDDADNFVDSVDLPAVYIYGPDVTSDTIDAEIEANTFTSAMAGPYTPTRIDTGFYELIYTVPLGTEAGSYSDVWVGAVASTASSAILNFSVVNGADVSTQRLLNNELIIIELDKTISGYNSVSLGTDIQLSFITRLVPYYASTDLVRMEIGTWIDFIPDSTLAMMIHWSSKEADFIRCGPIKSAGRINFARAKFVSYDAVLRALYLPGSFAFQPGGILGTTKRLGDLSITNGNGAIVARTASGIDTQTLAATKAKRDEWFRVVNAGGDITPGQSFDPQMASKGKFDPDRRNAGRLWADPDCTYYEQGGVNKKSRSMWSNNGRFYWQPTQPGTGSM